MTTFEYLAVLFSVVVGLAVTQTLRGLLRIVHHRKTMAVSWPALIWTAGILQWTVFFWWFSGLDLARLEEWRFTTLLFALTYGSILFFLLGLLHPDDVGPDFDMRGHFEEIRPWFFGVFLGLGVLDGVDSAYKIANGVSELEGALLVQYLVFLGLWIVGAAVLLRIRSHAVAGLVGIAYLLFAIRLALVTPGMGSVLPG